VKLLPRHRAVLSAAILVTMVVAVGVANYFIAGLGSDSAPSSTLAPDELLSLAGEPRVLLHLDWGDGSAGTTDGSVEHVFMSDGMVFVVDHTATDSGPRVRWFDDAGRAKGEHTAPIGATGFAPNRGGFAYVVSRGNAGLSETAAVFACEESRLTTYTVPLGLAAARVLEIGSTLYAQVDNSLYDSRTLEVTILARLVPVAREGLQVSDEAAAGGIVDGFDVGLDGRLYGRSIAGRAVEGDRPTTTYTSLETSAALTVSEWSQYIGVDKGGRAYFLFEPETVAPRQGLVGSTATAEQYSLVLIGSVDGGPQWVLPVRLPRALQIGKSLFALAPQGLMVTRATATGIDVVLYEGTFQ